MRTAASPKHSSHPIYPRPVSPLQYEPLHTRPEDVLFEQESEGSGNDEEYRAAKRRRIEKLAQQYLRGDGLFILTAGIKGPLGGGWKNPWEKIRSKGRKADGLGADRERREIPETATKIGRGEIRENAGKKESFVERKTAVPDETADEVKEKHTEALPVEEDCRASGAIQGDPFIVNNGTSTSDRTPEVRDKTNWLKTDHVAFALTRDFDTEGAPELQISPSTITRHPPLVRRSASPLVKNDQCSGPRSSEDESFDGRAETIIKRLRKRKTPTNSICKPRREQAIQGERRHAPETRRTEPQPPPSAERPQSSAFSFPVDATHKEDMERGPSDVRKLVGTKLPSPPAEGVNDPRKIFDSQGQLPRGEPVQIEVRENFKPNTRLSPAKQSPDHQSSTHHQQESDVEGSKASRDGPGGMAPPLLSTETTSTTVISTIPSAQVTNTQRVLPPYASLPSTGDQLSDHDHGHQDGVDSFHLSTQAAIAAAHLQMQKELTTPQAPTVPGPGSTAMKVAATRSKSKSGITPFSAFNKPELTSSNHKSINTQEMLDAVTPFDLTTTIKKVPLTMPPDSGSPTITAKKAVTKSQRTRKRASFAPEATGSAGSNSGSSHGSIKVSLKVTKNTTEGATSVKEGKGILLESSVPSEFGKLGLDMETSCEEDQEERSNGARKPDDQAKTAISKSTTNGSSKTTGQDAQKVTPRPVLNHLLQQDHYDAAGNTGHHPTGEEDGCPHKGIGTGEDFDLSAAMDEVGSFLQSWDTEKEVRELKKENMRPVRSGLRTSLLRKR
jgi:hypothetical protein